MNIIKKNSHLLLLLIVSTVLFSCNPEKRINRNFNYFQNGLDSLKAIKYEEPKIHENDLLTIQVIAGSVKQEDATVFNLSNINPNIVGNSPIPVAGYQVDVTGNIELPKLGKIKAAGYTRAELGNILATKLKKEELVKDPLVIVKFLQFRVNVLGEVKKPGPVIFRADKANVLEAIADAGDLTDYAKREDILLMRQREGVWETFKIDLRNTAFVNSPAFQLQHNDVIYVSANDNKLKTLNVNPNFQRDFSLVTAGLQTLFFLANVYAILKR